MKLKEIQNLIKFVAKSGASEVKLEMEDVKITIKTNDGSSPIVVQDPCCYSSTTCYSTNLSTGT
jgi:hypothetical protein